MSIDNIDRPRRSRGVGASRVHAIAATVAAWAVLALATVGTASAQQSEQPSEPPAAQPATTLGYAEAVRLADDGPTVRLATRALELAERQLAIASAPVRGELSAGYRWTSGERDLGVGEPVDLTSQGYDAVALTLTTPVLGLGPAGDAIARARADLTRAQADVDAARRAALIDVTGAFQNALRARTALTLAEAEVELAALERRAAELRAEAGAATDAELARLGSAEARLRNAARAAAFEVEASQRALELALGTPVAAPTGPLPSPEALLEQVGDPAWEGRSDVLAAVLGLAESERTAAATLRDQVPSLGVRVAHSSGDAERSLSVAAAFDTRTLQPSLSLSYDPDTGVPGVPDGGSSRSLTVGVTLRVPLDPSVGSAVAAARIARERAEAQLELARARAELDVERRAFELTAALADAELARASADLARADLAIAEARHASGALSELALARARLDARRAELDADRAADAARLTALRLLDALATDPPPVHQE